MVDETAGRCWNCSVALGKHDYGREIQCLGCGKPTRVCRNCRWFAPGRPNDCEEPMADPVLEKERANFCSFFEPADPGTGGDHDAGDDLLEAAEALFKS